MQPLRTREPLSAEGFIVPLSCGNRSNGGDDGTRTHDPLLDQQRFPATLEGHQALSQWAGRWDDRQWAVEGAHGVGRSLAQQLVADGEHVVDVPAKLAARVRVLSTGHGRKTDPADAVSVAVAARSAPGLRQVSVEDHAVVLHLLTNRREDLVHMRTQTLNRLHR